MSKRLLVKRQHERAHIQYFINWLNDRKGSSFEIVANPDPPDAIIRSNRTVRWVEVASVFMSDDYARDLNSYATPGEQHVPMARGPFAEPDRHFADRFARVLRDKLEKASYGPAFKQLGPGYLILPMMYPMFDNEWTVHFMRQRWQSIAGSVTNRGYFRSAFIGYHGGMSFQRWRV